MKNWKLVAILAVAPMAAGLSLIGATGCEAEASGTGAGGSAGSSGSSGSAGTTGGQAGTTGGQAGTGGAGGGASGSAGSSGSGAGDVADQLFDDSAEGMACKTCLRGMAGKQDKANQIDCGTVLSQCGTGAAADLNEACLNTVDCMTSYAQTNETNGLECHIFDCQNTVAEDPAGFSNEFVTCLLNHCSTPCGAGLDALGTDRPTTCATANPPGGGAGSAGSAGSAGAAGAAGAAGSGGLSLPG